jgi:hypothetical protein
MLVSKGFLRLQGVGRNPEYRGLRVSKRVCQTREVDGLLGAAWGVRARIEKQHQFPADVVVNGDGAAAVAWQTKRWRVCALGQG